MKACTKTVSEAYRKAHSLAGKGGIYKKKPPCQLIDQPIKTEPDSRLT